MFFDGGGFGQVAVFDMSDEPVAAAVQRLDIAGFLSGIAQHIAQLLDCAVQTGIEVDKSVRRPEFFAELFARDHVTRVFQQERKHPEGLILQLQADAVLVHLARAQVHLEGAEARPTGSRPGFHRRESSLPVLYHRLLRVNGICAPPDGVHSAIPLNS
ncbi:MAG: hypothetical protein WA715_12900 [Candidatus Acidiferrum sp.]